MQNQPETTNKKSRISWIPLEGNPDVWNKLPSYYLVQLIHDNGVDPTWSFHDIYGFDPELLDLIPRPVTAIIFEFPTMTENDTKFRKEQEKRILEQGQIVSHNVIYFKQTIYNACGMMALIHALANNKHLLTHDTGVFREIIDKAEHSTVNERIDLLEKNERLAFIHEKAGKEGQTKAPEPESLVEDHYTCFTKIDGDLYELDGDKSFPINHGPCEDLVECAAKIMRETMKREPEKNNYSAMALSKQI
ncbi:hypothetical protein INT45_007924 [Circinella minor]|uniref:ubiquitinyl hydrolase 1 n=1 Tax=Circinella minor TaxID=1195481 RepID=A0A8H7VRT0_9FUNG|nr:hypothetical protein INT45_007924 [Circinella minor]